MHHDVLHCTALDEENILQVNFPEIQDILDITTEVWWKPFDLQLCEEVSQSLPSVMIGQGAGQHCSTCLWLVRAPLYTCA